MSDHKWCSTCGSRLETDDENSFGECYSCRKLHEEKFHKDYDIKDEELEDDA